MRLPKIVLAAASLSFAFSSTAARAEVCQPGTGCVLPLPGPAPVANVPVDSGVVPVTEEVVEGGFNFLPFLIGLAVLAGIAAYLLLDDDEDTVSP